MKQGDKVTCFHYNGGNPMTVKSINEETGKVLCFFMPGGDAKNRHIIVDKSKLSLYEPHDGGVRDESK